MRTTAELFKSYVQQGILKVGSTGRLLGMHALLQSEFTGKYIYEDEYYAAMREHEEFIEQLMLFQPMRFEMALGEVLKLYHARREGMDIITYQDHINRAALLIYDNWEARHTIVSLIQNRAIKVSISGLEFIQE